MQALWKGQLDHSHQYKEVQLIGYVIRICT